MTEETVIDQTVSSRPIRKPLDRKDEYAKLVHVQEQTEAIIEDLEKKINARETNEQYKMVLRDTKNRLIEIAMNAMSIAPDDAMRHSEALGNYKERILLSKELLNLKMSEKKQRGIFFAISQKLSDWTK